LAVTLAQETSSDDEIGWQLAQFAWEPQVETRESPTRWVRDYSRRDEIYWEEIPSVGTQPVVVLSPPSQVEKRQVQRRVATGEQLLKITLPDRQPAATALHGALKRAEAAWAAHDKRYSEIVRADGDPETDVMLLRLTAECWRIAAEVAQAMPFRRWTKADVFAGRAIAQEPRDRAAEIEQEADRLAKPVELRYLVEKYCASLEAQRLAGRRRLIDSLRGANGLSPLAGLSIAERNEIETFAQLVGPNEIRALTPRKYRSPAHDAWLCFRVRYDDRISTSGRSHRRNVEIDSIDLLPPLEDWERAVERKADAAAKR